MTHTPGPWKSTPSTPQDGFECYWITAIPNPNMEKEVATVAGPQNMTNEANANLIAAGPDLLVALEAYVEACYQQDIRLGTITGMAQDAIAKARGES